jgi:hypothetical protein
MFEIANCHNPQRRMIKLRVEDSFQHLKGFYSLDKGAVPLVGNVGAAIVGASSFPDGYSSLLNPLNHIVIANNFDITNTFTIGISFRQAGRVEDIPGDSEGKLYHTLVGGAEHEISIFASGVDESTRLRNGLVINGVRYVGNLGIPGLFLTNGAWHNVAIVYNSAWTHLKVYANGVYAGSIPAVTGIPASAPFILGSFDRVRYSNNAYLRNFRVYNKDLSAAEIQQIHTVRPN